MAAQARPRPGVAADVAGPDPGDDLAGPAARVLQQLVERLRLDHVVVIEAVAGQVAGGRLGDDPARAPGEVPRSGWYSAPAGLPPQCSATASR